MVIADRALFGFASLDDLWKQEPPKGGDRLILRYHDAALDLPVLRKCNMKDEVLEEPMPKSEFLSIYQTAPAIFAAPRFTASTGS